MCRQGSVGESSGQMGLQRVNFFLCSFTLNRIFKFDRLKRLIIYAYCISLGGLSTGISPQTVMLWPQSLNIRTIQKVLRMQLLMF